MFISTANKKIAPLGLGKEIIGPAGLRSGGMGVSRVSKGTCPSFSLILEL